MTPTTGARRMPAARARLETLRVADVMSPRLETVPATEPVLGAAARMSHAGVRHLPVVDADGRCLGVVDLSAVALAWPSGPEAHQHTVRALLAGRRTPLLRVDHPLPVAAEAMAHSGLDGLPVVSEDERLVGIVTAWDLVRALAGRRHAREPDEMAAELETRTAWAWLPLP